MPLMYSIITEFSVVMERLARSIRLSVLRNIIPITTTARSSGTREEQGKRNIDGHQINKDDYRSNQIAYNVRKVMGQE